MTPDPPVAPDLYAVCESEAQAAFALACASEDVVVGEGREAALVAMAMQAGIVGALGALRER